MIIPQFLATPDKRGFLSAIFLALELFPILIITQLAFIAIQILVYAYIASWIYDKIRFRKKPSHYLKRYR
jgi:uncharacterized membrane protein